MREYAKKPESQSRTLESNPKASRQAPIDMILQRYKQNIQRTSAEEEDLLQGKFETLQRKENRTGLPDNLKTGVENMSGYSMDDVRVHYNSSKPAQLQALAYTQGTDIHVGPGQEQHLPHEAWHVVQQKQGRVQPTMQLQGININDNAGLEHEADVMGGNVILSQNKISNNYTEKSINNGLVQRMVVHYGPNPPKDMNVIASLPNIVSKSNAPVKSENDSYTYAGVKKIGILAHGSQGGIGWGGEYIKGDAFANNELIRKKIDKDATVDIWSCQAGTKTTPTSNDSLVDAVKDTLDNKISGNSIKVTGVAGGNHIVLNDTGDHYVIKDGVASADTLFVDVRNKHLKNVGFFPGTLPPENYDKAISEIDWLFNYEKATDYNSYCEQKRLQWNTMCALLKTDPDFISIADKVPTTWYER